MILLFDLGNSRIKCAQWVDGRIVDRSSIPHQGHLPDELREHLRTMATPAQVVGCHVSSETLAGELDASLDTLWGLRTNWVKARRQHGGLTSGYDAPELLGVDRWVAMLGALQLGLNPCCIVDCGTAVTVDVVDRAGQHRGGLILAGLALGRQALSQRAHRLSDAGEGTLPLLATETLTAIRSGTFHGLASAIQGLYETISREHPEPLRLVLTGGDAPLLAPAVQACEPGLQPDLVFHGLLREVTEELP